VLGKEEERRSRCRCIIKEIGFIQLIILNNGFRRLCNIEPPMMGFENLDALILGTKRFCVQQIDLIEFRYDFINELLLNL
jgi:hypothetical protein